jgi:hypothetical protein
MLKLPTSFTTWLVIHIVNLRNKSDEKVSTDFENR